MRLLPKNRHSISWANMRRIRIIRNEILKSDMFRKLGALKSSAKLYYDNDACYLEVHKEIEGMIHHLIIKKNVYI
jgi:hypothetical protein